jgi:hypothetical protein
MLGKFIAGEMRWFPASNEITAVVKTTSTIGLWNIFHK